MARKRKFAFRTPLTSPDLEPFGTDLILAGHVRDTVSCVQFAHGGDFQFTGILLPGHFHCAPPFNVNCPLFPCLTFGVQTNPFPAFRSTLLWISPFPCNPIPPQ